MKRKSEENNCQNFSPEKLIYVLKDHRLMYIQTYSNILSWEKNKEILLKILSKSSLNSLQRK